MNNLQHIVKDSTRIAMHVAVELCENGDFDSITEAFRWLMEKREESKESGDLREEIVRCRDCRYYDPNDEPSEFYPDRYWCNLLANYLHPDGFCAWGERREP